MKDAVFIKKIKENFVRGDFSLIIQRIQVKYGVKISRSAVAATLNPNNPYTHELIYAEALQLSIERKKAISQVSSLEQQL